MSHDSAYPVGANGVVYATLIAIYVVLILLTNTVGTKLFELGGVAFPVSLFCFPFTFLVTDIVSDIFGAKKAQYFVILGFLASLALLAFVMIGLNIPASPAFAIETEYQAVFGPTWRLFFASMMAYLFAQSIDVRVFHWIKKQTGEGKLWLRNNASTMVSQLVDTCTVLILFLYKNPIYSGTEWDLLMLILQVYLAKVIIAIIDTPICYVAIRWIRSYLDTHATQTTPTEQS